MYCFKSKVVVKQVRGYRRAVALWIVSIDINSVSSVCSTAVVQHLYVVGGAVCDFLAPTTKIVVRGPFQPVVAHLRGSTGPSDKKFA